MKDGVDLKQVDLRDFTEPTMIVSVGKYLATPAVQSLEDAARGYWRVGDTGKACQCVWLMAVDHGRIIGAWNIDQKKGWMKPALTPKKTWPEDKGDDSPLRRGCELKPFSGDRAKFVNKTIKGVIRLCFPFKYIGPGV